MSRFTAAILLFFLAAGAVFFVVMPQWRKAGEGRAAIAELQALNEELAQLAASRDALVEQYNEISEEDIAKLKAVAPQDRGTSGVLADFEALAIKNGLSLDQVDFTAEKTASGGIALPQARRYGVIPLNMSLKGTYESFRGFLIALERNLRLMDVDEITISSGQGKEAPIMLKGAIYYRK